MAPSPVASKVPPLSMTVGGSTKVGSPAPNVASTVVQFAVVPRGAENDQRLPGGVTTDGATLPRSVAVAELVARIANTATEAPASRSGRETERHCDPLRFVLKLLLCIGESAN